MGQNILQTTINLDLQKDPLASSSLLSPAVPMPSGPLAPNTETATSSAEPKTDAVSTNISILNNNNNILHTSKQDTSTSPVGQGNPIVNFNNTQPVVPPPPPPPPPLTTQTPPTTKPKAPAKASTTRKKSTDNNNGLPKPKASRAKKTNVSNINGETNSVPKLEPKVGVKSKTPAKSASNSTVALLAGEPAAKTPSIASTPSKRKPKTAPNQLNTDKPTTAPSPAKRQRKKKTDAVPSTQIPKSQPITLSSSIPPSSVSNPHFLTNTTNNAPLGTSPLMINTPIVNNRLLQGISSIDGQDISGRYYSPMISPYPNLEHLNPPSLSRSSLSRLFTSSSADNNTASSTDDPEKAFEELRDNTWSHLSKCILEQSQQFDLPSLIGTLYTLRSENEKMSVRVRELLMKRDQLIAANARLDLPGPMLTQHLINTSPNFSSVVSSLTNSPRSLPTPSPGSAISKPPHISVGSYNHVPPNSLVPGFLDRSSPLVGQTHSGSNNIKSTSISTPSPPIGALMAHSNNNRAGLITVNPPYMSSVYPPMRTLAQLDTNPPGSSF